MMNAVDDNDDDDDYFDYGDEWDNVDSWEAKQTRHTLDIYHEMKTLRMTVFHHIMTMRLKL